MKRGHGERVAGVGEQAEVHQELVLGGDLQVVAGLGLPVVHRVLLHAHERGVLVRLGHRVAFAQLLKAPVVLVEFVALLLQLLGLSLEFTQPGLLSLVLCLLSRSALDGAAQFLAYLRQLGRRELHRLVLRGILLGDGIVYLAQKCTYLLLQSCPVLHHRLLPDEGVFVRLRLYLRPVDVLHFEGDEATLGKDQHQLREHVVDLILDAVAEVVDGLVVGLGITGQPYEMNVTLERVLHLAARVDVVHVTVDDDLEHHPRVVGARTVVVVQGVYATHVQAVNNRIDQTDRVVRGNIFVDSFRKKNQLVVYVLTKV